jgi:hypothetical protein
VASVAQNRGIQLRSVEAAVEGDHDIRGILVARSQKRSAVFDALTSPTNVTVEAA